MDSTPPPIQKKGLGVLGWLGIGCGSIVVLGIIAVVAFTLLFGGKIKQFAEDAQKNPTRTVASTMVNMSGGKFEMAAEDDENKRYTVKEKETGKLTTIYWDEKKQSAEIISGDFSAIPAADSSPADAAPSEPAPTPRTPPAPAPAGEVVPDRN